MAFNPENYFDFWNIFAFEIVGGTMLAMIIGLILIAYFSARNAVPFQTAIAMMLMWIAIVSVLTSDIGLYTLVIFIVGLLFYWVISRMFRRG